ncbi:XdhC family protein [Nocardia pseudovaccinii]|uniref:XdhC family protein n=1 Tax=Nocardia pseudovaccinii TaxID=189540 RepID=UPI0007A52642|nr:XdhC/CoxI family protein [Nocardia pseudovaccinii]
MLELIDQLIERHTAGMPSALATVIDTSASTPRPPGAAMAITAVGEVLGSISGGCVEAATVTAAESVLESGVPSRVCFGITDNDLLDIGLTCGGTIEVLIEKVSDTLIEHLRHIRRAEIDRRPTALCTVLDDPQIITHFRYEDGGLVGLGRDVCSASGLMKPIQDAVNSGHHALVDLSAAGLGDGLLFLQPFTPAPRMIVFGAVDFARDLTRLGKLLGYHVTVCDARPLFTTEARFPEADLVVVDRPERYLRSTTLDERTVLCVMTHDPKFDIPLLESALRLPVAFVGAMGSRQASAQRAQQLRDRGVTDAELARLHAPIGLDIGGATPMETAVSIAAEIIAAREHRMGLPLTFGSGSIHSLSSRAAAHPHREHMADTVKR